MQKNVKRIIVSMALLLIVGGALYSIGQTVKTNNSQKSTDNDKEKVITTQNTAEKIHEEFDELGKTLKKEAEYAKKTLPKLFFNCSMQNENQDSTCQEEHDQFDFYILARLKLGDEFIELSKNAENKRNITKTIIAIDYLISATRQPVMTKAMSKEKAKEEIESWQKVKAELQTLLDIMNKK